MANKRHGFRSTRKKRRKSHSQLTDGQKSFLKQTGELHPSEAKDSVKKYTQIKDEDHHKKLATSVELSSESDEEENAYSQLLTSIGQRSTAAESSEEEVTSDEEKGSETVHAELEDEEVSSNEDEDPETVHAELEEGSDLSEEEKREDEENKEEKETSSFKETKNKKTKSLKSDANSHKGKKRKLEDADSDANQSEDEENDDHDDDDGDEEEEVGETPASEEEVTSDEEKGSETVHAELEDEEVSSNEDEDPETVHAELEEGSDLSEEEKREDEENKEEKETSSFKETKNKKTKSLKSDANSHKGKKRKLEDADSDANQSEDEENDDHDDDDGDEEEEVGETPDPFSAHFEKDLEEKEADGLMQGNWEKRDMKVHHLGKGFLHSRNWKLSSDVAAQKNQDLGQMRVKQSLFGQVKATNETLCHTNLKQKEGFSSLQQGLFSMVNAYQDVYYAERTHHNGEEVRLVYCLHALNHCLKEYRDQGLTRPKVLIVLPFRESAKRVVQIMSSLLAPTEQVMVTSKKRFKSEYDAEENSSYRRGMKPEDFESIFSGNFDDHFRLGIAVSKKSLKLYVPFYKADIILASPLGLRTIIGAEGEKERDYDFLSSIDLLILDQADVFLMQNWDHVLHMLKHLHLQPKESHDTDFSRVRMWTLNGWSQLYRQTLIFSAVATPELNAVFNKHCHNYAGKIQLVRNPGSGSICQIITQTPQTFQRINCLSFTQLADARFEFFIKKVVPHHKDRVMVQTLVYIPSYFDFVRIRNYFKKESVSFVHMSEYASDKGISRVRCDFFHGQAQFLLYTERLHFYRRFRVRGIKHIIFYELPLYPHFYSEMCNMMKDPKRGENKAATCTVLYSKYDAQKLAETVGSQRAAAMLNSDKSVHMFVTGEDS